MIKKLNLMSKQELYYRTRSPYHIIDTLLSNCNGVKGYQEGYKKIYFTREHEDFVIWEDVADSEDDSADFTEINRISYEEFIKTFKDYNFEYFNKRREYLVNRWRLEKNSVWGKK
jgi:hypothetical protein